MYESDRRLETQYYSVVVIGSNYIHQVKDYELIALNTRDLWEVFCVTLIQKLKRLDESKEGIYV